mmetsp:Transcript_22313/g.69980  ORF Transcript_22313/g.69980 Transcript_22313/m.69980 type:complete len:207 (+) Transcript_22313:63-683(+)
MSSTTARTQQKMAPWWHVSILKEEELSFAELQPSALSPSPGACSRSPSSGGWASPGSTKRRASSSCHWPPPSGPGPSASSRPEGWTSANSLLSLTLSAGSRRSPCTASALMSPPGWIRMSRLTTSLSLLGCRRMQRMEDGGAKPTKWVIASMIVASKSSSPCCSAEVQFASISSSACSSSKKAGGAMAVAKAVKAVPGSSVAFSTT